MTDTHALQALRDEVAAGHCPMHLAIAAIPTWSSMVMAAFDGSLDAAKELHEALLPDWKWSVDYSGEISLWHKTGTIAVDDGGQSNNPARAWLLAILDALIHAAN